MSDAAGTQSRTLTVVGVSHHTAAVDVRERLGIADKEVPLFLAEVRRIAGVEGAAILSTCNRVEVVVSSSSDEVAEQVVATLCSRAGVSAADLEQYVYVLQNAEVVRHLFRVTAGLDSMIVGEPQIGGQVREAFRLASDAGTLDPLLHRLYEHGFRAAKRARSETGIGEHAVSVPFAAVELARKIFGDLRALQVLVVGAGEMAELTAEHLNQYGVEKVFVANRARERAAELAARFGGEAIDFSAFPPYLESCDVVIVSTAAPHYVIDVADVTTALASRRRRELFLIDLSVPRNIDPAAGSVAGAYLYNIDDLEGVVVRNREERQRRADDAEIIIAQEVDSFLRRIAAHQAIPTIVELQERVEEIRRSELERCLRRMGPISADQREVIETLTSNIINKILHYPIVRLKESAADDDQGAETIRETIRRIFGLRR